MRIDFHVHCNNGEPELVKNLAAACVKRNTMAALSGGPHYGAHDYLPNEKVMEICREYPGVFIPLARFELWDKVDPALVYKYAEAGFKGLKFIYPYYEYDHDIYMDVYEAAEKCRLPALFHTGNFRPSEEDVRCRRPVLKNMDPLNLDRVARSFQSLHIVMAHLGTTIWREQAAEYIKMHANLYSDLAGSGSWMAISADRLAELLRPTLWAVGNAAEHFDKIILGSDAYVTHPHLIGQAQDHYDAIMENLHIPDDVREKIMGGTVASWLAQI